MGSRMATPRGCPPRAGSYPRWIGGSGMSLSSEALLRLHPGRKRFRHRRPGAERDRKSVESEHVIKSTVMAQRIRLVGPENAADAKSGYCLGRLLLKNPSPEEPLSISRGQFHAGERYASLCIRHASIMGYPIGSPRSANLDMVAGGISCRAQPDEKVILEIRRDWSDAYRELMDAGRANHRGTKVALTTYDICIDRV